MSITPIENPTYDVCLWPVDPACLTDDWEAMDPVVQTRSLALASATLHRLTGYRVGGCPVTVRPCKVACASEYGSFSGFTFQPYIDIDGRWLNACGCVTSCSCSPLCEVVLPPPVGELQEVLVGATDVTDDCRVDGNRLVWVGAGDCPFPTCQDLAGAVGAPDTFAVTYLNSYPVDGMGAYAAAVMAMEFAKACAGKTCRLPKGTTSVARQGLSIQIVTGAFPDGMTGIHEVDAYIALWRPEGSPRWAPRVWSPGQRVPRVT